MTRTRPGFLRAPEKAVQQWIVSAYTMAGCEVYSLSQPRRTMQTPGVADLYVVCPKKGVAFWHEVKAEGGKLSPAQVQFVERNRACGVTVVVGGLNAARAQLEAMGLVRLLAPLEA